MIERATLITQLETTGYLVKVSVGTQPDFIEECFQVGYLETRSIEIEKILKSNILDISAQEHIQGFEILLAAKPENYVTMWLAMHDALAGWIPYENENNLSGFVHTSGQIIGINNNIQVSREIWYTPFQIQTPLQQV